MKLLVNDANILIDIVKLDIVDAFLSLNFELYTTDFVFAELEEEQQKEITSDNLQIISTDNNADFAAILELSTTHSGLSFEDCSVWYYAQKLGGTLITGDGILRKKVINSGLEVKGIIYILDEIKAQNLLTLADCIEKISQLKTLNNRLPHHEIDARIQQWTHELT